MSSMVLSIGVTSLLGEDSEAEQLPCFVGHDFTIRVRKLIIHPNLKMYTLQFRIPETV